MRVDAQRQQKSGSSYARRRERRLSGRPFLVGKRAVEALFASTKTAALLSK